MLITPCHSRAKLKTYGERSIQHAAPKEWNKLFLNQHCIDKCLYIHPSGVLCYFAY